MTSQPAYGSRGVRYWCRLAGVTEGHPKPYTIAESKLLPWARVEVARWGNDAVAVSQGPNGAELERLTTKRAKVVEAFLDSVIGKPERDRRLMELDAALEQLSDADRAVRSFRIRGPVDWTAGPAAINSRLRELWRAVQLGRGLMPVAAEWIVTPEARDEAIEAQEAWISSL